MNVSYPTIDEPASPEYVLSVMQDDYRQQCQYDPEAQPDVELTFKTTVAEWRNTCDLVATRELGRAENQLWGIRLADNEWRAVLEPAKERTLADVCELIARGMPLVRGLGPLACSARTARPQAFLTVRSLFAQAGVDATAITPSTPLDSYARHHTLVFLGPVSRLAPGALPLVMIDGPKVYDRSINGLMFGVLVLWVGSCFSWFGLAIVGALTIGGGGLVALHFWLVASSSARHVPPDRVVFGDLRTFRDLATVLAHHDDRRSAQGT